MAKDNENTVGLQSSSKNTSILKTDRRKTISTLLFYGAGEGANSLMTNGLFGFGMLFYTEVLGLPATMAAAALSVSVFWEAISEPLMGYISDNTRSRWGSRFPWILGGGLFMSVAFVAVWTVPSILRSSQSAIFTYIVAANLLLRSGLSVFLVPYMAVGFEIIPSYNGRARLQAVRQVANMALNFCGPALAWSIFFRDRVGPSGRVLVGTRQAENYLHMGLAFAVAAASLVLLTAWGNRAHIVDNRKSQRRVLAAGPGWKIWREFKPILLDGYAQRIFLLTFLACGGMVVISSMQSYLYVYFMKFEPTQRVIAHGSTMVAMATGGAASAFLSTRLDKKGAAALGAFVSIIGASGLALIFLPGWVPKTGQLGLGLFVGCEATYWLGAGIILPVLTAMIGDAAELARRRSGQSQDGGYVAAFSLVMRLAISFSIMLAGWLLTGIGFDPARAPSSAVVWRIGAVAFAGGSLAYLVFLERIARYPLTRARFESELAADLAPQSAD